MSEVQFTVTIGGLSHARALALADQIDEDFAPLAVAVNETDERSSAWEVVAYVATGAECTELTTFESSAVVSAVPMENWVEKSLRGLAPVTAGRFFLYGSHDASLRRSGGVSLVVNAGTAFGTGHHATTAGCLLALDHILKSSHLCNIFDLGCGTGVLAIAAQKVVRSRTLATDIDPEATRVTKLNARRNSVSPALQTLTVRGLKHREISRRAPFDLIFANILARPLDALATGISRLLSPSGWLVLSGITVEQKRWILARYRNQRLALDKTYSINGWVTLVLRK